MSQNEFQTLVLKILYCSNTANKTNVPRQREHFEVSSLACSILWSLLVEYSPEIVAKASHDNFFLWSCMMLKTYATKNDMANKLGGIDEKPLQKWVWKLVGCIGKLAEVVVNVFFKSLRYGFKLIILSYISALD